MFDQLQEFADKKNILRLLVLAIIVLAIPLGVKLVREQQLLKSRAAEAAITFTPPNVESRNGPNGAVQVATDKTVGVQLIPPWPANSSGVTPTPTP